MPSGDAQRAWFPEMLEELRRFWKDQPGWLRVVQFCEEMTSLRSSIREQRGIRDPVMICRSCGGKHAMTLPPVSPRSLLFALQKIHIINENELKQLDKQWKRFQSEENLDAQGKINRVGDELAIEPPPAHTPNTKRRNNGIHPSRGGWESCQLKIISRGWVKT